MHYTLNNILHACETCSVMCNTVKNVFLVVSWMWQLTPSLYSAEIEVDTISSEVVTDKSILVLSIIKCTIRYVKLYSIM